MNNIAKDNIAMESKEHLSSKFAFRVLLALVWTRYTVLPYIRAVVLRLPIVSYFADWVIPILITGALILALPYMCKKIRNYDILFYIGCVLFVVLSCVLYPKNAPYIFGDAWRILGMAVPFYFLGICYDHETHKNDLFWCSLIGVLSMGAYLFLVLSQRELNDDRMNAAYNVLPSILYLIYWACEKKKIRYWLFVVFGVILAFAYGTRGVVVSIAVYGALLLIHNMFVGVFGTTKIIVAVLAIVLICLVVFTPLVTTVATYMSTLFQQIGVSSRIFDFFLEGELTTSVGRDNIREQILISIRKNWILGTGLMGDRVVTGGSYAHNLFLELWCQFGVIFGSLMAVCFILIPLKTLYRVRNNKSAFVIVLLFVCMVFIKLMMSSSYIVDSDFFFVMGFCISSSKYTVLQDSGEKMVVEK